MAGIFILGIGNRVDLLRAVRNPNCHPALTDYLPTYSILTFPGHYRVSRLMSCCRIQGPTAEYPSLRQDQPLMGVLEY
jgi:hypothetical protein